MSFIYFISWVGMILWEDCYEAHERLSESMLSTHYPIECLFENTDDWAFGVIDGPLSAGLNSYSHFLSLTDVLHDSPAKLIGWLLLGFIKDFKYSTIWVFFVQD